MALHAVLYTPSGGFQFATGFAFQLRRVAPTATTSAPSLAAFPQVKTFSPVRKKRSRKFSRSYDAERSVRPAYVKKAKPNSPSHGIETRMVKCPRVACRREAVCVDVLPTAETQGRCTTVRLYYSSWTRKAPAAGAGTQ